MFFWVRTEKLYSQEITETYVKLYIRAENFKEKL